MYIVFSFCHANSIVVNISGAKKKASAHVSTIQTGKCSEISYTFLFLISNKMLVTRAEISQNGCLNSKQGIP